MSKPNLKLARQKRYTSESEALKSILEKTGIPQSKLKAQHTEKMWLWIELDSQGANEANAQYSPLKLAIADYEDRDHAERAAAGELNTFQGNIKLVKQDDEHYYYDKVRG